MVLWKSSLSVIAHFVFLLTLTPQSVDIINQLAPRHVTDWDAKIPLGQNALLFILNHRMQNVV